MGNHKNMHTKYKLLTAALFVAVLIPGISFAQNQSTSTQGAITISADSAEPVSGVDVMGSIGNTLMIFRVTETSNVENALITDLIITDAVASTTKVKAAFSNLTMWNGSTMLGSAGAPTIRGNGYIYPFHFANPIVVPRGNSLSLTLKGDVASYPSGGATDNSVHVFKIAQAGDVSALGASSNRKVKVTVQAAKGNPMTVLRSTLMVTATPLGASQNRMKNAVDQLGTVTLFANTAGPVALNALTINFAGSAIMQGRITFMKSTQLVDQNGVNVTLEGAKEVVTSSTVKWTWPSGPAGWMISGGSAYNFVLRVNSTLIPPLASTSEWLFADILNASDVSYTDGLDASATQKLHLPAALVPITINSVSYTAGQ